MMRNTVRGGILLVVIAAAGCRGESLTPSSPDAGGTISGPPRRDAAVEVSTTDGQAARGDARTLRDGQPDAVLRLAPIGIGCTSAAGCASGFCMDDVCCSTTCTGGCVSCAVAGAVGTCVPVDFGVLDPHGACVDQGIASCGQTGLCNGAGGCDLYEAGTTCAPGICSGNSTVMTTLCDGAGNCLPGPDFVCTPYTCRYGSCYLGDCSTSTADCAPGTTCLAGTCVAAGLLGGRCSTNAECLSDICAQGVCCASTCDGICSSCALPGSLGACFPVPASERPDGSVCP